MNKENPANHIVCAADQFAREENKDLAAHSKFMNKQKFNVP